jgi:hypothetical protein
MSGFSNRKLWIVGCVVLFFAGLSILVPFLNEPLDLSNEEEPFRSISMPPQAVYGTGYMDGGSVAILIVDRDGKQYEITFPIDYDGIRNPYPKAFHGNINDPKMIPLKDSERAKKVCIRLIDEYGKEMIYPNVASIDFTEKARRALASPPDVVAVRAYEKTKRFFGY